MLKLKEIRTAKNLSQKEVASKINLTAHNIGDWERGKCEPSIYYLSLLADQFGCSVDYLLGREDDFGNITIMSSPSSDSLASSSNASLTPEERELLELYKKLPGTRKKTVLDTIRFMSDSSETSDKTRKEKYYGSK